jgi:hypothetical protein
LFRGSAPLSWSADARTRNAPERNAARTSQNIQRRTTPSTQTAMSSEIAAKNRRDAAEGE